MTLLMDAFASRKFWNALCRQPAEKCVRCKGRPLAQAVTGSSSKMNYDCDARTESGHSFCGRFVCSVQKGSLCEKRA